MRHATGLWLWIAVRAPTRAAGIVKESRLAPWTSALINGKSANELPDLLAHGGFGERILLHALLREHVEHHREIYYAPQNILTVLPAIRNTYSTDAPNATPLHVVDWSGEVLTTRTCDNSRLLQELLKRAEARLRQK